MTTTIQWRSMIQRSLGKNRSLAYSRYVQLATVRPDGRPANRTVVFRGFLDGADDCITFVTDRRSAKVEHVASNPAAEVAWYLPITREQYRISGTLDVVQAGRGVVGGGSQASAATAVAATSAAATGEAASSAASDAALAAARRKAWANMSDAGRAQFVWPHPGLPRIPDDEATFTKPAPDGAGEPAADFCLVVLRVDAVDYINLKQNRRVLFTRRQGRQEQGQGQSEGKAVRDGRQQQQQQQQQAGGRKSDGSGDGADEGAEEVPVEAPRPTDEWDAVEVNP